jgi:DNA-directed RNA polymerase specialized sigma24 family protein
MRRRLVVYFDRKNCPAPDELADETLNRVARRLEEEGKLESDAPARYCYTVARFVFMEHLRGAQKQSALLVESRRRQPPHNNSAASEADDECVVKEKMLSCLERCLGKLDARSRGIIIRYYAGKERAKIESRRALAEELGISMNALSIRACRIRDKLEACVRECARAE